MKKLIAITTILTLISAPFFADNHVKNPTKNDPPVAIPPMGGFGPPALLPPTIIIFCLIGCGKDGTSSTPTTPSTPATPSYSM